MDFISQLNVLSGGQTRSVNQWLGLLQPLVTNVLPDGHSFTGWGPDDLANYQLTPNQFLAFLGTNAGVLNPVTVIPQSQTQQTTTTTPTTNTQTANQNTNTTNGTTTPPIPVNQQNAPAQSNAGLSTTDILVIGGLLVGGLYFMNKGGR